MEKYFNVNLEFNKDKVNSLIQETIKKKGKGYVCSVERNVMSMANNDKNYLKVINNSLVNICDGNFVAKCISIARGKRYISYIGADLFVKYVRMKKYNQYFLGNRSEILDGLKNTLTIWDSRINNMKFQTLPFKDVNDFDYLNIAEDINNNNPDIIWVSLGAPKQELFMSKLFPYLNKGIMFGFGAIFNFYSGDENFKRAPNIFLRLKLEWLYRMKQEPKKNFNRNWMFLKMAPRLIIQERLKINNL